ncbi:related to Stress-activated map kinase interacting protein 1 [Melanopsichium pennsylvanicum]|uniref:Related to Stress-activated map kinase interacting protein 1 n=2 Tax=Melanopsichium pennsylvanicum TaxID=63383 RepID=A0AAJ5C376_9BASI|nr:related to Stress-activated map kinase interacting protein 1 [Melanopsichium pennsylvanicum 4]SNX82320.1 related to Stress-activated map kinase interacting protein 1 [Melanopsichium pennsylvanicum]
MSLIVDPDYLIHSLRLAYLKRIDDQHGPRIITFPYVASGRPDAVTSNQTDAGPSLLTSSSSTSFFASSSTAASRDDAAGRAMAPMPIYGPLSADSHVVVAGLTDASCNPELATIYSPVPTVGEAGPFGSFGPKNRRARHGADVDSLNGQSDGVKGGTRPGSLSYTQTIYGPGRSGALGMRVDGRRASKRVSIIAASSAAAEKASDATTQETGKEEQAETQSRHPLEALSVSPGSASANDTRVSDTGTEEKTTAMGRHVNFAQPKFPRSLDAEPLSEGQSLSPRPGGPASGRHGSTYAESSTESNTALSSLGSAGSLQDGSLGLTTINAAITGGSHSPHSSASRSMHPTLTARSSPVRTRPAIPPLVDEPALPAPPKMVISATYDSDDNSDANRSTRPHSRPKRRGSRRMSQPNGPNLAAHSDYFSKIRVSRSQVEAQHANRPKGSILSSMLHKQDSGPENPFAAFYAGIAGRSATAPSMTVELYFPWAESRQPPSSSPPSSGAVSVHSKTNCMKLNIRKDATMEEVIGYGLYCYVEEKWKPALDPPGSSRSESEREARTTTIGWTLMIVEDGEVDDDFPAIDQSLLLGKFGGDEFAICEATPNQIKQHRDAYTNIARRTIRPPTTSKTLANKHGAAGESLGAGSGVVDASQSTLAGGAKSGAAALSGRSALASRLGVPGVGTQVPAGTLVNVQGTPIFASGTLSRSALGSSSQSIFLRVLVTPNPEVRYKTTLQVPSDMYLADVLEMICRKRHLSNVDEWALIVPDKSIVVPLDRTVESLQGNHDLALVRRSSLGALGGAGALSSSSTNPNASIFKRYSTTWDANASSRQPKYTKALDIAAAYKSYTVYRKSPMFGGRHNERSLTLDGDWLHIMPIDMKTFGKAASFHVSSVVACKLSSKITNGFKLVVWRESPRDTKRYDLEADSGRIAAEIVREINALRSQNS